MCSAQVTVMHGHNSGINTICFTTNGKVCIEVDLYQHRCMLQLFFQRLPVPCVMYEAAYPGRLFGKDSCLRLHVYIASALICSPRCRRPPSPLPLRTSCATINAAAMQYLASGSDDGGLVIWKDSGDNKWNKVIANVHSLRSAALLALPESHSPPPIEVHRAVAACGCGSGAEQRGDVCGASCS